MKTHTDYFDAVTRCLMTFQYIEEALKMVLVRLECLTYFRLKNYTHYDLKPKLSAINNAAMGRLISMLSVYTEDACLIAELNEIKKRRDEIAHQSLLMTTEEADDREAIDLKALELESVNHSANSMLAKICARWKELEETLNKLTAEQASSPSQPS